jgi:hypothetical protein
MVVFVFAAVACGGTSAERPDRQPIAPPEPTPVHPAQPAPSAAIDCGIILEELNEVAPNRITASQCLLDALAAGRPARLTHYSMGDDNEGGPMQHEVVRVNGAWKVRLSWDGSRDPAASAPVIGSRLCDGASLELTASGARILSTNDCQPDQPAAAPPYCGRIVEGQGEIARNRATASRCFLDALAARRPALLVTRAVSVEGDPIVTEYEVAEVADRWLVRMRIDASADRFAGSPAITTQLCATATPNPASAPALAVQDCR